MTSFIHRRAPLTTPRNCGPGRERLNPGVIMRATKLFRPCGTTSVHGWNKGRPFEKSCRELAGRVRHLSRVLMKRNPSTLILLAFALLPAAACQRQGARTLQRLKPPEQQTETVPL